MAEIELDGRTMVRPEGSYGQFFAAAKGLVPDYGSRNLDALDVSIRSVQQLVFGGAGRLPMGTPQDHGHSTKGSLRLVLTARELTLSFVSQRSTSRARGTKLRRLVKVLRRHL